MVCDSAETTKIIFTDILHFLGWFGNWMKANSFI